MKASICATDCANCPLKKQQCFIENYIKAGGEELFCQFKEQLLSELNALHVEGLPLIEELHPLAGDYVNLAYPLPSGDSVKLLDDKAVYLGNQLHNEFGGERCFGIVADMNFLLVVTYADGGSAPELVLYKKR